MIPAAVSAFKGAPGADSKFDVAIVGGGPGGLAAAKAILTARPDLRVGVFERSTLRPQGGTVTFHPNGFRALRAISPQLEEAALAIDSPVGTFRRHDRDGKLLSTGGFYDEILAFVREHGKGPVAKIAWHQLQAVLADALQPGVLRQEVAFDRFEEAGDAVTVHFKSGPPITTSLLIGADGGQSAVRAQCLGDGPPLYADTGIWRAVIPRPDWWPDEEGAYCIFGGPPTVFMAFGLKVGTVAWQAFGAWPADRLDEIGGGRMAYTQDVMVKKEQGEARRRRALEVFGGWCKEVVGMIEAVDPLALTEHGQFYRTPESCKVWGKGRVTLLGDAAHLPSLVLAQGTSQAVEDALALGRAIGEHGPTPAALRAYEAFRQPQMEPIQAESVRLFLDAKAGGPPPQEHLVNHKLGAWIRDLPPLTPSIGPSV